VRLRHRQSAAGVVGLIQAAGFLTALFSLATAFNGLHQYLELFSHFRLQYLGVGAILLPMFVLLRRWRYALLMAATIGLNAWFVIPWFLPAEPARYNESRVKLVVANVNADNSEYYLLRSLLDDEQPDVVMLQEIGTGWAISLDTYEDYPYRYIVPRYDNFGIAMLSRIPFDDIETVASPPRGFPTLRARITIDGRPVTLITTHPMSPLAKPNYDARNVQLESLAELVTQSEGALALAGDLNTTMWGRNYARLIDDSGLRNVSRGHGVLPTWPTFMPFAMIPIDHCLVSDEFEIVEVRRGPDIRSDHRPLIVTLQLAAAVPDPE